MGRKKCIKKKKKVLGILQIKDMEEGKEKKAVPSEKKKKKKGSTHFPRMGQSVLLKHCHLS